MALVWLGDDGPLVLLSQGEAERWLGVWRPATEDDPEGDVETVAGRRLAIDPELDDDNPATDYARACAALDSAVSAATVPYEGGIAVALETTGHQAAFVAGQGGLVVAKWVFAPGEPEAERALTELPSELAWRDAGVRWHLATAGIVLHVAADRFEGEGLPHALEQGEYIVETAAYEPDDDSSFELWRLRRV